MADFLADRIQKDMNANPAAIASAVFAVMMAAVWFGLRDSALLASAGVGVPRVYAAFALLFAPLWFFGFGAAEKLKELKPWQRVAVSAALSIPYFVFAWGTAQFYWRAAIIVIALPVLLAAFLELPRLPARMTLRDLVVLAIIMTTYFEGWLRIAWPSSLALFPKLFLADVALYCYLVVRMLDGAGYSFIPRKSDVGIGFREWAFYFPIALALGESIGFIRFHATLPNPAHAIGAIGFTFFLVALPEEMFFRAILQNLLESRLGRIGALLTASLVFGLSHFNHGVVFNWRYVLLASVAGIFYGRAWRSERRVFASIVTHTAVDVVWVLWFR